MGITIVSSDNSVNYYLFSETESYGCPMFLSLNFTALITETKGKLTTPSAENRVDAFVERSRCAAE
ncbi:hypothetical protein CTM76_00685 [Photobacterium phosphoreum]|jgi:hypothetical protein|nr:hypothetical protein AYY25_05610 [Photobacterium phosphoreum]PSU79825.1 hypothetical protein CTM76_00685 [Photobacterium phosphoreum]